MEQCGRFHPLPLFWLGDQGSSDSTLWDSLDYQRHVGNYRGELDCCWFFCGSVSYFATFRHVEDLGTLSVRFCAGRLVDNNLSSYPTGTDHARMFLKLVRLYLSFTCHEVLS